MKDNENIKCWYCGKKTMKVREKGDCQQCTSCGATENIGWGKPREDARPKKVKAAEVKVPS